jgi:hypothetical protein|tara:strand:+ start:121 stop:405 length:285 start_codon:yes stop_codon:yes gene_type:complete
MTELNKINFNQNLGRPMGRQADLNSEGRISDVTRLEGELQIEGTVSARTMNAANSESYGGNGLSGDYAPTSERVSGSGNPLGDNKTGNPRANNP